MIQENELHQAKKMAVCAYAQTAIMASPLETRQTHILENQGWWTPQRISSTAYLPGLTAATSLSAWSRVALIDWGMYFCIRPFTTSRPT